MPRVYTNLTYRSARCYRNAMIDTPGRGGGERAVLPRRPLFVTALASLRFLNDALLYWAKHSNFISSGFAMKHLLTSVRIL